MMSIPIKELSKLEVPLVVAFDDLFTSFKIIELNALEFSKRNPFRFLLVSLLFLCGFLGVLRSQRLRKIPTDLGEIITLKNQELLVELIHSHPTSEKFTVGFVHSGTSADTLLLVEKLRRELDLDLQNRLFSIEELANSYPHGLINELSNLQFVSTNRPPYYSQLREIKFIKVRQQASFFAGFRNGLVSLLVQMRVRHWIKNLLVLVPLFAAQKVLYAGAWSSALTFFVSMSLIASGTYIFNDIVDLKFDSVHAHKRFRPIVSGLISLRLGIFALFSLLVSGFLVSIIFLNSAATLSLIAYLVLTLSYSLSLKNILAVDIVMLATLHTLRLIGGSLAIDVPISFWMISFSMFIFFSLGAIKRSIEIGASETNDLPGRPYIKQDLLVINVAGICSGLVSVLILALYVQSPEVVNVYYGSPELLFLAIPILLYWIFYTWLNAYRGKILFDPIVWATKDRVSRFILLLLFAVGIAASLVS
jgi:4-hydroxybenzoate polyprenyltransferase